MTNTKMVYSARVARELIDRGFMFVNTTYNPKRPDLNAFLFEDTEEFRQALEEIIEEGRRNGK